jgi:CPA1 family monovalent cation:H+ antiporter
VTAGIALAFLPIGLKISLTGDLIFSVLLPPLIFEAALQLKWDAFRRDLPLTVCLALIGVFIASLVVAAGMSLIIGWNWIAAALFGVLIAATDPVSVIAAFKDMKVQPRLSLVVEAESLLNDGAAAVGFALLVGLVTASAATPMAMGLSLLWTVAGGVLSGIAVAGSLLLISGRTDDHFVEITLTTIAAYGSFMLAERLHASGVLASLSAGLLVRNLGWMSAISETSQAYILDFWEYAAFLANSFVFILIGVGEASQRFSWEVAWAVYVAVLLVLLGRALAVYPLAALFGRSRSSLTLAYQHVLVWGGLRGALALALALALPIELKERQQIIAVAFGVVAFSIFVQGISMPWLIAWLGLLAPDDEDPAR